MLLRNVSLKSIILEVLLVLYFLPSFLNSLSLSLSFWLEFSFVSSLPRHSLPLIFIVCLSENIFDNLCRFVVSLPLVDCLSFLECIFFSPRRRDWPLLLLLFHMLLSAIHVLNFMLLRRFSTLVFLWMSSEEDVACSIWLFRDSKLLRIVSIFWQVQRNSLFRIDK